MTTALAVFPVYGSRSTQISSSVWSGTDEQASTISSAGNGSLRTANAVFRAALMMAAVAAAPVSLFHSISSSVVEVGSTQATSGSRAFVRSRELADLQEQLAAFVKSPYLDDDDNVRSLIAATVRDAMVFLSVLPSDMPLPWASHSSDGEVFLKWRLGQKEAEAMFSGEGAVGYALLKGGRFVGGEAEAGPANMPSDLIDYFNL